jgi:anti-sigma-K factor RskA
MEADAIHELTAAYALDALDEAEEREYEAHLARCPRCRAELASFTEAASALAYGTEAPAPPPGLRDRILEQASSERPKVVPLRPRALRIATAAAALAACAALGFAIWAISLSRSLDRERAAADRSRRVATILADPAARRLALSGGHGTVVVARTGVAALLVAGFDRAPHGKTYEAWVIQRRAPKRAGLFGGGRTAEAIPLAQPVPDGAVVAVTLEQAGGVDEPTGTPLTTAQA